MKESSCYDNIYSSIPSIKENCEEFFSEFKNHDWISKKDLLIEENFRTLNSHKHMLWCFSYFHLIFSKSMYFDNCCLLATLTNQIFQDSFYLYYHNDTVPFVTGLDRFIDNNYLYLLFLLILLNTVIIVCFLVLFLGLMFPFSI